MSVPPPLTTAGVAVPQGPLPTAPGDDGRATTKDSAQHLATDAALGMVGGARLRPMWQRLLWGGAGGLSLLTGLVGVFMPLLPTVPFVLLAAFCFARSSTRCERWLLSHPRFGPMVRNWRARRAIPPRVKRLAWTMMAIGSAIAAWRLPLAWAWLPAAICLVVALWMSRLPDA